MHNTSQRAEIKYTRNLKGHKLAYVQFKARNQSPEVPGIIFLPGFKSDMSGSKATYLETMCQEHDISYLRFDYSGHGLSDGHFYKLNLSDWLADVDFMMKKLVPEQPQILVGSSMGGWLGLRMAELEREQVKAFVGIACAPDFTREISAKMSGAQRMQMEENGYIEVENDYSPDPYIFTKNLLVDGEEHCMLDRPINYDGPVRLLQGMQDDDVPWKKALRIKDGLTSQSIDVTLIEDGNHSLSRPNDLEALWYHVHSLYNEATQAPEPHKPPHLYAGHFTPAPESDEDF